MVGSCIKASGRKIRCQGKAKYLSMAKRFTKALVEGEKSGFGIEYDRNGAIVYEGTWKNDLYHGEGKLSISRNEVYEGYFEKGKKHGLGI